MKIRPVNKIASWFAVCRRREDQGGIIIPDTAKEKPAEGEVVAWVRQGPMTRRGSSAEVKKGDRVAVRQVYSGNEIKLEVWSTSSCVRMKLLGIIESNDNES